MTKDLQRLQSEWDQLKAEVDEIQAEYKILCDQRSAFQVQLMFPQGNSSEDLETFHQQAANEVAKWSVNLKALNQKLRVTRVRLKKKRTQMIVKQTQIYRMQAHQLWPTLCQQAEEINQIVDYLQQKLQTFKQTSHNFHSQPYSWLPKHPELVEVNELHLPTFVRQDNHWTVKHQTIDWDGE
jgi:hypothetical protein